MRARPCPQQCPAWISPFSSLAGRYLSMGSWPLAPGGFPCPSSPCVQLTRDVHLIGHDTGTHIFVTGTGAAILPNAISCTVPSSANNTVNI